MRLVGVGGQWVREASGFERLVGAGGQWVREASGWGRLVGAGGQWVRESSACGRLVGAEGQWVWEASGCLKLGVQCVLIKIQFFTEFRFPRCIYLQYYTVNVYRDLQGVRGVFLKYLQKRAVTITGETPYSSKGKILHAVGKPFNIYRVQGNPYDNYMVSLNL